MSFAHRLKEARKEKGYSQEQLSEELEVSRQSITKWETGTAYPELKKLLALSVRLDKDLDFLFSDEMNELKGHKGCNDDHGAGGRHIYDLHSLKKALDEQLIDKVVVALDGMEPVIEADFTGESTYYVFDGAVYVFTRGTDPQSGEAMESFRKLDTEQALDFLISQAQALKKRFHARSQDSEA